MSTNIFSDLILKFFYFRDDQQASQRTHARRFIYSCLIYYFKKGCKSIKSNCIERLRTYVRTYYYIYNTYIHTYYVHICSILDTLFCRFLFDFSSKNQVGWKKLQASHRGKCMSGAQPLRPGSLPCPAQWLAEAYPSKQEIFGVKSF